MSKSTTGFCVLLLALTAWAGVYAEPDVDELPDLTGGVIPLLYPTEAFGSGGQLSAGGRLTTRQDAIYDVRVKNQSGDPIDGDSLVVVVHKIQEAARLRDMTTELEVVDADGYTGDGKPYFRVPMDGEPELAPYALSEAFRLEIRNPDLLRLYPPVLRVRGIRRTASQEFQKTLQTLVQKGVLTPEEAEEALEQGPEAFPP